MKIFRKTDVQVKLTVTEFLEALGITDEGYVQKLSHEWVSDYHRTGCGATVVTIDLMKRDNDHNRKAGPRRKR